METLVITIILVTLNMSIAIMNYYVARNNARVAKENSKDAAMVVELYNAASRDSGVNCGRRD